LLLDSVCENGAVKSTVTERRKLIFGPCCLHFSFILTKFATEEYQTNKRTECLHLPKYWRTPGFTQARQRISVLIFNTFISPSVQFAARYLHIMQLVDFFYFL